MRILEYIGLDTSGVGKSYKKLTKAIAAGDFRAAQVKKLSNLSHGKFYRARLDGADRLLFSLVRHEDEICALMLEVIRNHDYEGSRFLRGVAIDEDKIPDAELEEASQEAQSLRYLHPEHAQLHLLDKPISFDDAQEVIYRQPAPLILVGSAGSGKTALTLEKLKQAEGEVLYVTHSAYLAQSARDLYYANGFEHPGQEALFLSYREFLESIRVPQGREALWRDFAAWFARMRQNFRGIEAHQAFEEIRGVIAASATGVLSRDQYLELGIRQSIFARDQRELLYDLFEKYRTWLAENRLFDLNLVAQEWMPLVTPRYDFLVMDEVQDITPIQLSLALKSLRKPGHFLLCGDSNQIVHPNFFSWSQVKSLFWSDPSLAERQQLSLLTANFRNGQEATRVANQLLKIKQRRFGSIDRESNFLVQAIGGERGEVSLVPDKENVKKELDAKIRKSTQFAVLVMRDEDKAEARKHFSTPLLFSIQEAKGLEYENILLYRFVSNQRAEFNELVEGVEAKDLLVDELEYRRAKDKGDKSLEVYKFFVNALYVALTRAIRNLYIIESDLKHPLFGLLELSEASQLKVEAKQASLEDWQKEARKLELQGKQEQADAIRKDILKEKQVPWPVFDQANTEELMRKVFHSKVVGSKLKQQMLDIAFVHNLPLVQKELEQMDFDTVKSRFPLQRQGQQYKSINQYSARNFKEILRHCDQYGVEHRLPMNMTPLMAAATMGNVPLVEALLERGANLETTDHFGYNALHWAMQRAFEDKEYARGPFGAIYELVAPASVDINSGDRLVRIDRHLSEYFLFQTFWTLFRSSFTAIPMDIYQVPAAFDTQSILNPWAYLPANVVRPERYKRAHISSVLSRNEINRDYAYNRKLFMRIAKGWYQFNPKLSVRRKIDGVDTWVPIFETLNIAFVREFVLIRHLPYINRVKGCMRQAGLPEDKETIIPAANFNLKSSKDDWTLAR